MITSSYRLGCSPKMERPLSPPAAVVIVQWSLLKIFRNQQHPREKRAPYRAKKEADRITPSKKFLTSCSVDRLRDPSQFLSFLSVQSTTNRPVCDQGRRKNQRNEVNGTVHPNRLEEHHAEQLHVPHIAPSTM